MKHTNNKKKLPKTTKSGRLHTAAQTVHSHAKRHHKTAKHWWQNRKLLHRIVVYVCIVFALILGMSYGVAQWYIAKHADEPLTIGATFIPWYAEYLGLNPEQTMDAMIDELEIRRFRLVSYWDKHEAAPGEYDFSALDWQFDKVEEAGGTVSLAIGLRQPRWPECHWPQWAQELPQDQWEQELKKYMGVVIDRYKDRPSLESYQLENEFFLSVFGKCPDHSRERLIDEFNFVKSVDPNKPLIVSRSNNATPSWPVGEPRADLIGASIYKRVWDKTITKRYFEYPLPSWFYAFLAGGAELTTGRNTFIHELQAEAWLPPGYKMNVIADIPEQDKSFNAQSLEDRIQYSVDSGIRTMDLWGVEWWYWRKVQANDPSIWNAGRQKLYELRAENVQCPQVYSTDNTVNFPNQCQ